MIETSNGDVKGCRIVREVHLGPLRGWFPGFGVAHFEICEEGSRLPARVPPFAVQGKRVCKTVDVVRVRGCRLSSRIASSQEDTQETYQGPDSWQQFVKRKFITRGRTN